MFTAAQKTNATEPPQPGQFGRFYLQELINSGGMADIWLATDGNQKAFALRRMLDKYRFDFFARRRFVRGCEILAAIADHPGIIGYVEHGKQDGKLFCLMEYVEASNLKELYARHDPVLLEHVAQIIIDMAAALEHMHTQGYMHLDFKPENVLVSRNASVRLVDFDLAQPIPEKPKKASGKNPGTPAYMAPEQLLGEPISARVGHKQIRLERVNLEELFQRVVVRVDLESKGREILWDIHPLPEVEGDRELLDQVVANLVGNAVKFTRGRAPARIEIGVLPDNTPDEHIVFYVKDNGAGFEMTQAGLLFKAFQRLHADREYEGTGIGLVNVQRIIHKHGGRVWAEGQIGQGATFFFSLPRKQGPPASRPEPEQESAISSRA